MKSEVILGVQIPRNIDICFQPALNMLKLELESFW